MARVGYLLPAFSFNRFFGRWKRLKAKKEKTRKRHVQLLDRNGMLGCHFTSAEREWPSWPSRPPIQLDGKGWKRVQLSDRNRLPGFHSLQQHLLPNACCQLARESRRRFVQPRGPVASMARRHLFVFLKRELPSLSNKKTDLRKKELLGRKKLPETTANTCKTLPKK